MQRVGLAPLQLEIAHPECLTLTWNLPLPHTQRTSERSRPDRPRCPPAVRTVSVIEPIVLFGFDIPLTLKTSRGDRPKAPRIGIPQLTCSRILFRLLFSHERKRNPKIYAKPHQRFSISTSTSQSHCRLQYYETNQQTRCLVARSKETKSYGIA